MTEQQIRENTPAAGSAVNGTAGDPTMATEPDSSHARHTARERTATMAQAASAAALNAAGTLRNRAGEIPGGDRSAQAARAVADRVEQVANRAMGRQKQSFFERLSNALTDNKFKVAIGAALLAAVGAFVTHRTLNEASSSSGTELADEA